VNAGPPPPPKLIASTCVGPFARPKMFRRILQQLSATLEPRSFVQQLSSGEELLADAVSAAGADRGNLLLGLEQAPYILRGAHRKTFKPLSKDRLPGHPRDSWRLVSPPQAIYPPCLRCVSQHTTLRSGRGRNGYPMKSINWSMRLQPVLHARSARICG